MSVTSRTDDHRTDEHSIQCAMTSRDAFIRFFNRATRPIGTACKLKLHRSAIALVLLLVLVSEAQAQAPSAMEQGLRDMLTGSGAAAQSSLTSPALTPSQALLDANGSQAGPSQANAAQSGATQAGPSQGGTAQDFLLAGPEKWTSREGLSSSLQIVLLLTVISLAPAILLMTTCYVRIIVVLGLLRQALGTGQLPPSQVVTSIALFMTMFVMAPVWNKVYTDAVAPYTAQGSQMSIQDAWDKGVAPVHAFMSQQIDMAGNHDDVHLFFHYYAPDAPTPDNFETVPLRVLLPAYMLSELKTSFLMGFQIFLPFLLIDLVVAAITISMGMMMLPPAMISYPSNSCCLSSSMAGTWLSACCWQALER